MALGKPQSLAAGQIGSDGVRQGHEVHVEVRQRNGAERERVASLPKSYQKFSLIYQINNTHTKYTTLYQKAPHVTT